MRSPSRKSAVLWVAAAGLSLALTACAPTIEHRGYIAKPGAFNQIGRGMSKMEVEGILGSPSTTASVNYNGDSYYYITSVTESRAFLTPKETSREVIAIRFDQEDRVQTFAQYGLQDGRIIDVNTRKSAVIGEDTSILTQLLKGVGSANKSPLAGKQF